MTVWRRSAGSTLVAWVAISSCAPRHVARPGDLVRVRTDDARVEGRLVSATRDSVRIEWIGGVAALPRDAIERVSVRREHPSGARVLLGAFAVTPAVHSVRGVSRMGGDWKTADALEVGLFAAMAAGLAHQALQDSLWARARLPDEEAR